MIATNKNQSARLLECGVSADTAHNSTVCVNTLFSVRNGYQKPHYPNCQPKERKYNDKD